MVLNFCLGNSIIVVFFILRSKDWPVDCVHKYIIGLGFPSLKKSAMCGRITPGLFRLLALISFFLAAALQQTWTSFLFFDLTRSPSSRAQFLLFNAYQIEEKKLFDLLLDREGWATGTKDKVLTAAAPHLADPLCYAATSLLLACYARATR